MQKHETGHYLKIAGRLLELSIFISECTPEAHPGARELQSPLPRRTVTSCASRVYPRQHITSYDDRKSMKLTLPLWTRVLVSNFIKIA